MRGRRNLIVMTAAIVALAAPVFLGLIAAPRLRAQAPAGQSPAAQTPTVPQWQTDAGGKMAFDVASVKRNAAAPSASTRHSNIPLGPLDFFTPTGGYFSAIDHPLLQYIVFAYKLLSVDVARVQAHLPKWANDDGFDIEGRITGNPSKDQFRLMMQAVLAERFKLSVHYEAEQLPALALVFDKPGRRGPQLRMHSSDAPCASTPPPLDAAMAFGRTVAGGFPEVCGAALPLQSNSPERIRIGARNVPMESLAKLLGTMPGMDQPVLDETGMTGKVDFLIEFSPATDGLPAPGGEFQPDASGPTFLEALKDQLGLKLEPTTGPVDVLVIDHVEEPTPN